MTPRALILGIGTATPPNSATQDEALALGDRLVPRDTAQRRLLAALYRRSGVARRHSVLDVKTGAPLTPASEGVPTTALRMRRFEEHAPPLAAEASRAALAAAGVDASAITHLVTVSCTGAAAPGLDVELVRRLALRADVARTHVGFMGCSGALAGMRAATAYAADQDARVLLCAIELCSLHLHYGDDPDKLVANALFADGAAAAVIGARGESPGWTATTTGRAEPPAYAIRGHGSLLFPDSLDQMTWRIGEHGFEMSLSPKVPDLIEAGLRPWLEEWLARCGTTLGAVRSFAVHPGGPRILTAVEAALGVGPEATAVSREVLASFGNMSSPTVLFILDRLQRAAAPRPVLAIGFGPGLVAEAALLD